MSASRLGHNVRFLQAALDLLSWEAPDTFNSFLGHLRGIVIQFWIGREHFWLRCNPQKEIGICKTLSKDTSETLVSIQFDRETVVELIEGRIKPLEALYSGKYNIIGNSELILRVSQAFSLLARYGAGSPSFRQLYQDYKEGKDSPSDVFEEKRYSSVQE